LATAKDPSVVQLPFVAAQPTVVRETTGAPPAADSGIPAAVVPSSGVPVPATAAVPTAAVEAPPPDGLGPKPAGAPIYLADVDLPKCTDCATCYQELPQLFERTTILVDGKAKQVSRMIAGALAALGPVTTELAQRMQRVKDSCDAEIIQ